MASLQDLKNELAKSEFGMTVQEAQESHICIVCKRPVGHCKEGRWRLAEVREYQISGVCPDCFDKLTPEEGE